MRFQACICCLSLCVRNAWEVFTCKSSEEFTLLLNYEAKIYFIDRTFYGRRTLLCAGTNYMDKKTSGFTTQHALVLFDVNGLLLMFK
jgi:hypothetical protein